MSNRWITILSGPVAALALVTGCTGSVDGDEASADGSPAVTGSEPATETAGTLGTEEGGTESAGTQEGGEIAISVAGLPMGGDAENSDEGDTDLCVSVSYLGDDADPAVPIPAGFRITVTGGSFALAPDQFNEGEDVPDDALAEIGGSGCASKGPLCLSGFAFTAQNDEAGVQCFVPVHATRGPADGADDYRYVGMDFSVAGGVTCPGRPQAECDEFGDAAEAVADPIGFSVPFVTSSSSESSSSAESESSSSSAESSSESGESSESSSESAGDTGEPQN